MYKHYIYKITCLCGEFKNHYYIGKRTSKNKHIYNDKYYGSGEKLRRYYKKYPPQNGVTMYKEIIEINPTKEINAKREKEIIGDLYKSDPLCLNLMEGGNGRKVSKETSSKKSRVFKGRKLSEETKKKMSIAKKRDNSVVYLKKYYENHDVWNKGVPSQNRVSVACYDLDGNFIKIYESIKIAGEETGVDPTGITGCMKHPEKNHKAGNYMWTPVYDIQPEKIESYEDKQKARYNKLNKKYAQYHPDGTLIKIWSSVKDIMNNFKLKSVGHFYGIIDKATVSNKNNCNEINRYLWKKVA